MDPGVVWGTWIVAFLIVEVYAALAKPKGDTLSENVWRWFGVRPRPDGTRVPAATLRRVVLVGFLVSLTLHLAFDVTVGPVIAFGVGMAAVIGWALVKER